MRNKTNHVAIGRNIATIRKELGYKTQASLADAMIQAGLTIDQSNVSRAETGRGHEKQPLIISFLVEKHGADKARFYEGDTDYRLKYFELLEKQLTKDQRISEMEILLEDLRAEVRSLKEEQKE